MPHLDGPPHNIERQQEFPNLKKIYEEVRDLFFYDPRDEYCAEGIWDELDEDQQKDLDKEANEQDQQLNDLTQKYGEKLIDETVMFMRTIDYPEQLEKEESLLRFIAHKNNISINEELLNELYKNAYINGVVRNIKLLQERLSNSVSYTSSALNQIYQLRRDIDDFIEKGGLNLPDEIKLKLTQLDSTISRYL